MWPLCCTYLQQLLPVVLCCVCCLQWSYRMWKAQHTLGGLYERIYDMIRARGVPPPDETVLWACLARLKDPTTGEWVGAPLSEVKVNFRFIMMGQLWVDGCRLQLTGCCGQVTLSLTARLGMWVSFVVVTQVGAVPSSCNTQRARVCIHASVCHYWYHSSGPGL
jgi:hypothetical protein